MTELVGVRFTAEAISEIEEWRRQQSVIPSRADAIRALVSEGLASHRRKPDARAKELGNKPAAKRK